MDTETKVAVQSYNKSNMWTQNVNNFGEVGENEKQKKLNFGQEFYGNSNKVTIVKNPFALII